MDTKEYKQEKARRIEFSNLNGSYLASNKSKEILDKQPKVSEEDYKRIVDDLLKDGIAVERGTDTDKYLDRYGMEGMVFHDVYGDSIVYHTKLSYAGMHEEIKHIKQIKEGKIFEYGSIGNIECEIEAKEELIRRKEELKISDYEVRILKQQIKEYKIKLKEMK